MSDVPEGDKISEVGVIPEEWEEEILGKECELITKGTTPTSLGKEFKDDGINFIKIESLEENGTIIKEKVAFIDEETNKLLKRSRLKENDILVSIAGALCRIAIVKAEILPANTNQALAIVRLKPQTKLNRNYLFYFLNSARIKKHIDAINVQAAQANLSLENINDFTIFIPSLPEQQAIASALSDVDALITALEQLITKKRNIKQGAMQQLLTGEKRLLGFGGGWEVKKLGEIANFYSGGTPSTSNSAYYGGNITWITSSDLNKKIILSVEGRITQKGLENSSAKMVEENTLLIALYGATAAVIAITKIKAAINQAVLAIMPQEHDTQYLYYKISSLKTWIINTYTQGGQPNLSGNIVKSITLSLPPFPEQTAIAQILGDMDAEIEALKQKQAKYKAIKQGMMQELLTGKTRLV